MSESPKPLEPSAEDLLRELEGEWFGYSGSHTNYSRKFVLMAIARERQRLQEQLGREREAAVAAARESAFNSGANAVLTHFADADEEDYCHGECTTIGDVENGTERYQAVRPKVRAWLSRLLAAERERALAGVQAALERMCDTEIPEGTCANPDQEEGYHDGVACSFNFMQKELRSLLAPSGPSKDSETVKGGD